MFGALFLAALGGGHAAGRKAINPTPPRTFGLRVGLGFGLAFLLGLVVAIVVCAIPYLFGAFLFLAVFLVAFFFVVLPGGQAPGR